MSRHRRRAIVLLVALVLLAAHFGVIAYVRHRVNTDQPVTFGAETVTYSAPPADPSFAPVAAPVPFEEVDALGEDAHNWSTIYSQYGGSGVTIFDANGDGRLDIYLTHDGQNWTRATDENGVPENEPRYQSNMLYLNQGNDPGGRPVFKPIGELASNTSHAYEELLVEGYLFPRRTAQESRKRFARSANLAIAVDFNSDGRPDLLVGNEPKGIPWTHEDTSEIQHPMVDLLERQLKSSRLPLRALLMVPYAPAGGAGTSRKSSRGEEAEGANSLYLNMGDADGDGVPEWKDASRESGIEGSHATYGLTVADIDLDGDLDLYASSIQDMDFWATGSPKDAGGLNELFINQLAETGALRFLERADEMGVSTRHSPQYPPPDYYRLTQLPILPSEYSLALLRPQPFRPEFLTINKVEAEQAETTWDSMFQDVNGDGYPDLWIANDVGHLRVFINQKGRGFQWDKPARFNATGSWMSLVGADLNGDRTEDLFVGNVGGAVLSHPFLPDVRRLFHPTMNNAMLLGEFINGKHDWSHAIIDGADYHHELPHRVRHSTVLPPDSSLPGNIRRHAPKRFTVPPFDRTSIDPYEFSWGAAPIDVQNDGRIDIYYVGCLLSRGGGLLPVVGTNPGRLLVNAVTPGGESRFVDLTAEYHLFNIEEIKYDRLASDGYVYRAAPGLNWHAGKTVRSTDRTTWSVQGLVSREHMSNSDLLQTAEMGRAVGAADLNGDGFEDIVLTNVGGYDSRRSDAVNLRVAVDGQLRVVPPPDNLFPVPTNFEPGRTRVLLNRHTSGRWMVLRLVDDTTGAFNRDAIGARVVVNGRYLKVRRADGVGWAARQLADMHFGLGEDTAREIEVQWPDRARTKTVVSLDGRANGIAVVSKSDGRVTWTPHQAPPRAAGKE